MVSHSLGWTWTCCVAQVGPEFQIFQAVFMSAGITGM